MINLNIKKSNLQENILIYNFYDDINRIPLEIILNENSKYIEGINIENYDDKNYSFITFKFDIEMKILLDITFVSINEENIIYKEIPKNINYFIGNYNFYINKYENIKINYKTSLIFDTTTNSILFYFGNININDLSFYSLDEKLFLGIDCYNNLKSIYLKNLKYENIKQFLNL